MHEVAHSFGTSHAPYRSCHGTANLSPEHAKLRVFHFALGFVYICHTLSAIELCILSCAHPIDLEQSASWVDIGLAALKAGDDTLGIQTHWLLRGLLGFLLGLVTDSRHGILSICLSHTAEA